MIDIKEKDILDIIFELTHIKDEEGNDVPHFCFASDLAMDLDAKEEELAVIAAKNNYKIYKVFPGETMIGGIVFVADGATIEPVETMYKEFYGEVPEIIELKLDDEDNLVEVEEQTEDLDFDLIEPPTIEDKLGDYTSYMDNYKKLASELGAEIEFRTKVGPKRLDSVWYGDLYIATIKYGDWIFDIFGSGDYPYITVDGETFEGLDEFEENGIYNDETIPEDYDDFIAPSIDFRVTNSRVPEIEADSYGDLSFDSMWDIESALDIESYIKDVIPAAEDFFKDNLSKIEESKNERPKIRVGDPNAKAMWGRTRHRVELPKKGKGSFKRHEKHRLSEVLMTPTEEEVQGLLNRIKDIGFVIESVKEYEFWSWKDTADIHIQVYDSKEYEHEPYETAKEVFTRNEESIKQRFNELADVINDYDSENNNKFRMTYSMGFGGVAKDGTDLSGKISAGIDMRAYDFSPDAEDVQLNTIDEAKKRKNKNNPLKAAAKKHAKTDTKGAIGWFIHPNVEQSIQHFNHVVSDSAPSTITAPAGLGEDLTFDIESPYEYDFELASDPRFRYKGYKFDHDTNSYTGDSYWFLKIPETCMKVSREDYKNNKLLKMPKNRKVLKGVEEFFNKHKSAKWCVIGCRDVSYPGVSGKGKHVNVWRTLIEESYNKKLDESENDYWVLSDGKNPKNSVIYSEIDNVEDFISNLELSNHKGYLELLHYINHEPKLVWSTDVLSHGDLNESLGESVSDLKKKIKDIISSYDDEEHSKLHILETDPGTFVHKYDDDEDIDFSKFEYHEEGEHEGEYGRPPLFTFILTGGLNGSGKWADYLSSVAELFVELADETGLNIELQKIDADIPDDVWTAEVLMYRDKEDVDKIEEKLYNISEEGVKTMEKKVTMTLEEAKLKEEKENKIRALVNRFNNEYKDVMDELAK